MHKLHSENFLEIFCMLMCLHLKPCVANEPPHDKTNKMTVRPAKTQVSLDIAQSDQSLRCALNG